MVFCTYPIQFVLVVRHLADSSRALDDRKAIARRAKPIPLAGANVKVSIWTIECATANHFPATTPEITRGPRLARAA
jgi:hypothetical protein